MYNPMIPKVELRKSLVFQSYALSLGEREEVSFLELILSPTLPVSSRLRAFFHFGELKAITKVLRTMDLLKKRQVVKSREEALQHYLTLSILIGVVASQSALSVFNSIEVPKNMEEFVLGSFECTCIEQLNLTLYKTVITVIFDYEPSINYQFN